MAHCVVVTLNELTCTLWCDGAEYLCHVYVRRDGLSGIVVSDQEYQPRVAFALLNKLIDEFDKEQQYVFRTCRDVS